MLPAWNPGTPRPRGTRLDITPEQACALVADGTYAAWCIATRWTILDLDADGIAGDALADQAVAWCSEQSLPYLLVESGTPGHYHLHVATVGTAQAADLKAFAKSLPTGKGGGHRRPGQYIRAIGSPSDKAGRPASRLVLPSVATAVAMFEPLAAQMAGDRERSPRASGRTREPLPLVQPNPRPGPARPLPPDLARVMRDATGVQARWTHHGTLDRSENAAAVLLSAVNAGWSWSRWWDEVRDPRNQGLAKLRSLGERIVREEWNRAVALVIERPPARPREPGVEEIIEQAWSAALSAALSGLWGRDARVIATNLAAVAHAIRLADAVGSPVFGCADSQWQDGLATTSKSTVDHVVTRLSPCRCTTRACADGCMHPSRVAWLEPQPRDPRFPEQPSVYRLRAPRVQRHPALVQGCGVVTPIAAHSDVLPELAHDIFRAPGLDRAGWLVLTVLHHLPRTLPTSDLCTLLGRGSGRDVVNRLRTTLRTLARHGLAVEGVDGWSALPVTTETLDEAADKAGTAGTRRARQIEASRKTAEWTVTRRGLEGRLAQAVQGPDGFWVAQPMQVDPATGELVPLVMERPATRLGLVPDSGDADPLTVTPQGSDEDWAWVRAQADYYAEPQQGDWQNSESHIGSPVIPTQPFTYEWAAAVAEDHNGQDGHGHAEPREMPDGSWAVVLITLDGSGDLVERPLAGLLADQREKRTSRTQRRTA